MDNQEELTERERQVFLSIVHCFIETAEPVGSRHLAKRYNLNISPATIRNVMMDLEEKGFIIQPHTSAGRVPTNTGYRTYVNNLMRVTNLQPEEKKNIRDQLNESSEGIDVIIRKASQVISQISSQLGVVMAPQFIKGRLSKIELLPLMEKKLLVVLSIQSGLVKTVIVEINQTFSRFGLETINRILNERLHGVSIDTLQSSMQERFIDLDEKSRLLLSSIAVKTNNLLSQQDTDSFYYSGAKNVISQPEFKSEEKINKLLELLDRKDILVRILNESGTEDGVSIVIGEENGEQLMKNCSLITATYSIENVKGTVGVIGPTRLKYDKIIALVQFMSEMLGYYTKKT